MNPTARRTCARALHALERHPLLTVTVVAALLFVPWIASAPINGTLECYRLQASRELLRRGDWVLPTLNGEPYLAKPPFQYWLIELVSWPFGNVSLSSARAVTALAAIGLALLVAAWGRREADARTGILAALLTVGSGIVLEKGALAELEVLLALVTTAALFGWWTAIHDPGPGRARRMRALALAGLALGAGILTKGPVSVLVFAAAVAGTCATSPGRRARALGDGGLVLLVALAAATPWVLALAARVDHETLMRVAGFEVVKRLDDAGPQNSEPFWYYLVALPGGLAPSALFLPFVPFVLRGVHADRARARSRAGFLLGWGAGTVLLLSFSMAKEVRYLIATVPAWALLAALGWSRARAVPWAATYRRFLLRAGAVGSVLVPLALVVAAFVAFPAQRAAVLAAGALFALGRGAIHLGARRASVAAFLLGAFAMLLGFRTLWARGLLAHKNEGNPLLAMGREVAAQLPPGTALHLAGPYDVKIHFAVDRDLVPHEPPSAVVDAAPEESPLYLLTPADLRPPEVAAWPELGSWSLRGRSWSLLRRPADPGDASKPR